MQEAEVRPQTETSSVNDTKHTTHVSEAVPVFDLTAVLGDGGQPLLVFHEIPGFTCLFLATFHLHLERRARQKAQAQAEAEEAHRDLHHQDADAAAAAARDPHTTLTLMLLLLLLLLLQQTE